MNTLRYDTLNLAIGEVEKKLKSLKPPFPVWVTFLRQYEDGRHGNEMLGLAKVNTTWSWRPGAPTVPIWAVTASS